MKTVLITGASGFIAGHLAAELKRAGFRVLGASRSGRLLENFDRVVQGELGSPLTGVFENATVDAVIHGANYVGRGDEAERRLNVEGTLLWAEQAKDAGVGVQMLLSSISAKEDAPTAYGRAKFQIERWFLAHGQIILRLGLVVGEGGLCGRMIHLIRRLPVVPLLDNGRTPVFPVGIQDLGTVIRDMLGGAPDPLRGRIWGLYQPSPVTMRELVGAIRRRLGARRLFVPVPSAVALGLLLAAERLPAVRLPISASNVRGLRESGRGQLHSDLANFGVSHRSIDELVAQAV